MVAELILVAGDIVYTDSAGTTPLNGGSGTNWPYFPSGPNHQTAGLE